MLFKRIILIIISVITIVLASYFLIKFINPHKIYLTKGVIKYLSSDDDKQLLNKLSTDSTLNECGEKCFFYTDIPWSSKSNNYIYDKLNDRYYIIDKSHYYFINDKNYKIVVNKNINIKIFDFNKYNKKIVFL